VPLAGRSSFELAGEQAAFNTRFMTPALQTVWNEKPIPVARDPFIPEAGGGESVVGSQVTQGDPVDFALPANRGAAGTPLQDPALGAPRVTAVVVGPSPHALVDDGTHVRVVGIGDMLAGSRVTAIDAGGVHLQSGAAIGLAEEQL
jgi:hypothetical protein